MTSDNVTTHNGEHPHDPEPHGDSSISVNSLWKVFGKNPEIALSEELGEKSRREIQQELDLVVALRDVSFEVSPGETFVVMGLSGSGKSTLVRCLIRLVEPTSGSISVDGEEVTAFDSRQLRDFRRSKIAMVFQNFGLLPHKNVLDNAAYGLEVKGIGKQDRHAVAQEMLDKVGLTGWEYANQRELSGGMQQRVGLARALAVDPSILLMDEPFSGLDPLIRRQMRDELSALQEEIHKTIVFITHDLDEAITVGDRIAIMRDGEIIQLGTPTDIITNPVDDFVRDFTQGIPKTRVVKVSSIVTDPEVVCADDESIEGLIAMMDQAQCDYAVSIGSATGYMGIVNRKVLDRMIAQGNTTLDGCLDPEISFVHPDTTLDKALPMLSDDDIPLPIVDERNTFIGVATQKDLLKLVVSTA